MKTIRYGVWICLFALAGCNPTYSQNNEEKAYEWADFWGLFHARPTMQVPDYYSTKPLKKQYEFGKPYIISDFECDEDSANCR